MMLPSGCAYWEMTTLRLWLLSASAEASIVCSQVARSSTARTSSMQKTEVCLIVLFIPPVKTSKTEARVPGGTHRFHRGGTADPAAPGAILSTVCFSVASRACPALEVKGPRRSRRHSDSLWRDRAARLAGRRTYTQADRVLAHRHGRCADPRGHARPGCGRLPQAPARRPASPSWCTNNSIYTQGDLHARLSRMGLHVPVENIWTSALATAKFLDDQRPGGTAYVIGEAV
jgi:hypothetical protein